MSLLPLLLGDYGRMRPSRLLDQHFGMGLEPEDLFSPITTPSHQQQLFYRNPLSYYRPWKTQASNRDTGSTVNVDRDKFQINLDVQHFAPEEITVKVTDEDTVTVEGKHEEREDEHGFISRHFIRRYIFPEGHDLERIESKLSSDGILTITAPRTDAKHIGHRSIPITKTGEPSKLVKRKKQEE